MWKSSEIKKKVKVLSYFTVEILIFSHVTTFWIVKIVLIVTAANIPIKKLALVCFILKVNLCKNLKKQ